MKKFIFWMLIVFFTAAFLFSAVVVGKYIINSIQYQNQLKDLQQMHTAPETRPTVSLREPTRNDDDETRPTPTIPGGTLPVDPSDPTGPNNGTSSGMLPELKQLYALNSDVVGYIYIEGTNINYPVLQRKSSRDYYLYRDIFKSDDKHGCIYVREDCDVFEPSDNVTIYGHNMADGTMFANIHKFKDRTFFDEHSLIYFDTLYERHTYQIVCIFRTSGDYGVGFPFHTYEDFASEAEFKEFIRGIRKLAIRDSGISVSYGDKFICLSTCEEWPIENGRLVILAVRIS